MRRLVSLLLCTLVTGQVRLGEWRSYTSPLEIRDLQIRAQQVYAATGGGILMYDRAADTFTTLTNGDGLQTTDLQALYLDGEDGIWVGGGSPDGWIGRITPPTAAGYDLQLTEVSALTGTDSVVVALFRQNQDQGLILFETDAQGYHYKDVYKNWPAGVHTLEGVVALGDRIYLATDAGLLRGDWKQSNLKDPGAWQPFLPQLSGAIDFIRPTGDGLVVKSADMVYRYRPADSSLTVLDDHAPVTVLDVDLQGESTVGYLTRTAVVLHRSGQTVFSLPILRRRWTVLRFGDATGWVLGGITGLALVDTTQNRVDYRRPNAPVTNNFTAVTVWHDGRVIAGSKMGLSILSEDGWRNIVEGESLRLDTATDYRFYRADTIPVDFGGFVADLEEGPDGMLYCAIRGTYPEPIRHGGGIVILDIDHPEHVTLIDTAYLDYFTTASNPDPYMVVKDLAFDRNDVLWIADTYATNRKRPISMRDLNGHWGGYDVDSLDVTLPLTPVTIGFDAWNRVWVGSFREGDTFTRAGLYVLTYAGDAVQPDSFAWRNIPDLIDETVWSLGITSDNRLFYLTPVGLNYLDLQYNPDNPVARRGSFTYFPNISYGDGAKIRLDPRENIWTVSPTDGIYVLLNNTTYWPDQDPEVTVEGITHETSLLLSDEVTDIAFDADRGLAYITSKRGLNSLKIPFGARRTTFSGVRLFPSPFRVPSTVPLTIDRIPDQCTAKILTLEGRVVRTLTASREGTDGDQLTWDGKDSRGRWVERGVYLIALVTPSGESTFEKIAVIHR
ncbi:MAG: hypothetical protein D6762_07045 [Candidatus Neomarinimicrobiota bacterium]|nr:MAG: hypothetical protein D6762_07045 [Candidatus Neomarinimicrobiota bacterium]